MGLAGGQWLDQCIWMKDQICGQENAALSAEGWVDYQAHGVIHNINISPNSTDEFINGEMQGAIDNLQKYLNKTPIAYIWPGGGFHSARCEVAREVGYSLDSPSIRADQSCINWIPQADAIQSVDIHSAIPETPANDPLHDPAPLLARTGDARDNWIPSASWGMMPPQYAEQNKATELEYYDIVCAPTYGPIPIHALNAKHISEVFIQNRAISALFLSAKISFTINL